MIKVLCDKCGKEIECKIEDHIIVMNFGTGCTIDERHLCDEHLEEYLDFVGSYFEEVEG